MGKLANIASYVSEKISSDNITLGEYVTTDSLLQNKRGRDLARNLPPVTCNLTRYKKGDILIANIRPYLKKIWFANTDGGCSSDVLVFRAINNHSSKYLYATLMQDSFFDYVMHGAKGSKMPRGDKDQIMRYKVSSFSPNEEENVGYLLTNIENEICLSAQINHNLPTLVRSLEGARVRLAA